MRLLYLSALVLIALFTNKISAARYVALGNSRYRPYENLFNKKPKLNFRKQYYNRYISDAVNEIDKGRPKIRVCFNNVIAIEDPMLNSYDPIYKDSRIIAEYDFSKISKYTSLKFYLTRRNCHINLDFDRPLQGGTLGYTTFAVYNGKPHADVFMDRGQIQNLASSLRIPYLKAYMQVLMHEILHGLGLGHSEDDHNSKSIIRAVYDGTNQQLLYKKDVYNLRSIYGARRRQLAFPNGTMVEFDFTEPREWDDLVLRNMEDNSPEIKDVSSTTNNPVKTSTENSVKTSTENSVKTSTNPSSTTANIPVKPTTDNPVKTSSTTDNAPVKSTTNKSFVPTGKVEPIDPPPLEATTSSSNQSTTKKSTESTTESIKTTTRRPAKTTTKRPAKTTTKEPPSKRPTLRPLKTTSAPGGTTEKTLLDLQKELSKIKYSHLHRKKIQE